MDEVFDYNIIIFLLSLLFIASQFLLYPALIFLLALFCKRKPCVTKPISYKLSFIIVVHNADKLIVEKIKNTLSLNYAHHDFEIIVYLDGCHDNTLNKLKSIDSDKLFWINENQHLGKHIGINNAVLQSRADILVFSDADAILENNAIVRLLENFSNPTCGGACGQRKISENQGQLRFAQKVYIKIDSFIKYLENMVGSISANDGKLYAVRRKLFKPVVPAVTDDLYQSMSIIEQGYSFAFERHAEAQIKTPSRNPEHEQIRRRRIVSTSLHGIYLKRTLLNPFKYGIYSISLFINKVLRRLFPVFLLVLFISSFVGAIYQPYMLLFFCLQLFFYLLSISYPLFKADIKNSKLRSLKRFSSITWYFCLGNYATLLGIWDFLCGKRVVKWQPKKEM